jgi:hypothetical protein
VKATGTKRFTIVRNGTIRRRGKGLHWCGDATTNRYPYRVTLTVSGELLPPDYFVVDNQTVDDYVQAVFVRQRESRSCEKMCNDICVAMLDMMDTLPQWKTERINVELTGTNGRAWLSCSWECKP